MEAPQSAPGSAGLLGSQSSSFRRHTSESTSAKSHWQQAASTVIQGNRLTRNVNRFLDETKRSTRTTVSADRHDALRVREALVKGDTAAIDFLISRDRADLHCPLDAATGEFPLHIAAAALRNVRTRSAVMGCIRWIIDEHRGDIEVEDALGRSVLHVAANACDDTAPLLMLLARGADPLARTRPAGDLPSDFAKVQRHLRAKGLLEVAAAEIDVLAWTHAHPQLDPSLLPQRQAPRVSVDWGDARPGPGLGGEFPAGDTWAHGSVGPGGLARVESGVPAEFELDDRFATMPLIVHSRLVSCAMAFCGPDDSMAIMPPP